MFIGPSECISISQTNLYKSTKAQWGLLKWSLKSEFWSMKSKIFYFWFLIYFWLTSVKIFSNVISPSVFIQSTWTEYSRRSLVCCYDPHVRSNLSRIFWITILLRESKMQYLLICKVSRYCLLALHGSRPIIGTNVGSMMYMCRGFSIHSLNKNKRVNRVPLCEDHSTI